jgi:hypothetical protein
MPSQTSQKKPSVSIYCDTQNVSLNPEEIDVLNNYSRMKGNIKKKKAYLNFDFPNQARAKDKFYEKGFDCIDVPCPLKNSADNQLKSDLIDDMHDNPSDVVILVSGDGDFKNIVKSLRKEGKYVIVISRKGNVKQSLIEQASKFHYISDLLEIVQDQVQPEVNVNKHKIDYHQAVGYLIAAIKTAMNKSKKAAFGATNQLMMQMFPNYQGFGCIQMINGKSFKKFSDFIDAAVKDGKVKVQDQFLLLPE